MSDPTQNHTKFVPTDLRVTSIRTPVVPGYVTNRLRPGLIFESTQTYALADSKAQVQNLGTDALVLKFQETDNDNPSGTRTSLGSVAIAPGGTRALSFTPKKKYVEVKGIAGGGPVVVDISSKIDWSEEGFNEDLDSNYPPSLWADNLSDRFSAPADSASQTFTSNTTWAVTHNLGFIADHVLIDSTGTDITSLATFSSITVNGYTATFGTAKVGTAYSTK